MKRTILIICVAFVSGAAGSLVMDAFKNDAAQDKIVPIATTLSEENGDFADLRPISIPKSVEPTSNRRIDYNEDFVLASERSTQSVVFIKTVNEIEYRTGSWMDWFFQPRASQTISSGSGVIFSEDGYIVTNNHVIDEADGITVIHGKESYDAELIGTDPSTDLAVIKINTAGLPAIALGKSEDINVGEWALAVGNPFNLTSTVTAGIVSAKGRNINILRDKFPIESFIQTDAAINPGNSGGALVNIRGELIGINTAILSRTGSYAGYGFAVPVDIVNKVFNDLKTYGEVQKAFLGAEYLDIDSDIKRRMELESTDGVIITDVRDGWAADKAKVKKGDVILAIDGKSIDSKANLEELVGYYYPGNEVNITLKRDDETIQRMLTLTNREGTTGVITKSTYLSESLGVVFESVPKLEKEVLGIDNGVRIVDVKNGFFRRLDIPEGFIVTKINNVEIESPEELADILERIRGRVIISGIDQRGRKVYYPYMF
ncbi:MAG: trypsin-like peptidase domain-containing protein [Bacteroidota bacterium]